MGYRSEIIAGVPLEDKKKALEIIDEWDGWHEDGDTFYMHAEEWKWYDSYEDVNEFNKFIEKHEDRFLMVVGEDGALVKDIGDAWEHGIEYSAHIAHGIDFEEPWNEEDVIKGEIILDAK